jgi:site-specific recombinase
MSPSCVIFMLCMVHLVEYLNSLPASPLMQVLTGWKCFLLLSASNIMKGWADNKSLANLNFICEIRQYKKRKRQVVVTNGLEKCDNFVLYRNTTVGCNFFRTLLKLKWQQKHDLTKQSMD